MGDAGGIEIVVAGPGDAGLFGRVAGGVFDHPVRADMLALFLEDPRHHVALALEGGVVVGMCTANEYLHPDKPVQAWINELGVAPTHRRRGIGRALVRAVMGELRARGLEAVWLATESDNAAARAVYRSLGCAETEGVVLYELGLGGGGARSGG